MKFLLFIVLISVVGISHGSNNDAKVKRAHKILSKSWKDIDFVAEPISIETELKSEFQDKSLFKLKEGDDNIGYMLVTRSKGRFEYFDYMVIYTPEVKVKMIRIINYPSSRGGEICNKKWLNQFAGYDGKEIFYGKDVQAISGATISASAMVRDVERITRIVKKIIQ